MRERKKRLTVTVDAGLVEAGSEAVAEGRAESLSGWVNAALIDRARRDQRLAALGEAIAEYEAELGVITEAEMATLERADREGALVVRGKQPGQRRGAGSAAAGRGAA